MLGAGVGGGQDHVAPSPCTLCSRGLLALTQPIG